MRLRTSPKTEKEYSLQRLLLSNDQQLEEEEEEEKNHDNHTLPK
jgi:hypothetical protein